MSADLRRRALLAAAAVAPFAGMPAFAQALVSTPRRALLVLVELRGGNDGLNTVVPYADPLYTKLRPRLAIDRDRVLKLTPDMGLHPALEKLLPAWEDKRLAIVQGVGYPDPNLSHFRSIEIWDTASKSDEYLEAGWLSRTFASSPSPAGYAADGVVVGAGGMGPLAGRGARAIALVNPEQFLRNARLARGEGEARNRALAHILRIERDVVASARKLDARHAFTASFPPGPFGNAVATASQLAANEAGVSVVRLSLDGFDTHAYQLGRHEALLRQLGEGLAALRAALVEAQRWDSTVVATYAEFGRRPKENHTGGTDHGTASAHLVLGGGVRGGLYGPRPALDALDGEGNLPHGVDFRAYYATLLERLWQAESRRILGGRFAPLEFL
jgi:uncharacterized protein (DUF1501 family)